MSEWPGFHEQAARTLADTRLQQAIASATTRFADAQQRAAKAIGGWEGLREYAYQVKLHTLENLDRYLLELERHVVENGGKVFWAADAEDACGYIADVASRGGGSLVVKSKSMTTEEIELAPALARAGVETVETDLGEFIVQLAGERPYHIVAPAIHKTRQEVRELFERRLGVTCSEGATDCAAEIAALTRLARQVLRQKFVSADIGITGANFAVAESGTIVVVENEGNARLSAALPRTHIVLMGIEKVIPRFADLSVFLQLLPRAATGQKLTSYVSMVTGPRRSGEREGPAEFHLVLLDNGRSRILADPRTRITLACIRCGACLNVCPVYRKAGGYSYGSVYSGPIGAVLSPQLAESDRSARLPFASSLCGACGDVCPVKIPLPQLLLDLRGRMASRSDSSATRRTKKFWMGLWAATMGSSWGYRLAGSFARRMLRPMARDGYVESLPGPLAAWTKGRSFPAPAKKPFRALWRDG